MDGAADESWIDFAATVMVVAAFASVPLSFLLRWLYRRSVSAHMRALSGTPAPQADAALPVSPPPSYTPPPPLSIEIVEPDAATALSEEAAELYRLATRAPRRAAMAYALAGAAHAAVVTTFFLRLWGVQYFPSQTPGTVLTTFLALGWPVLPTVMAVAVGGWRLKVLAPALYVAAILVLLLPSGQYYELFFVTTLLADVLIPSALTLLVANRRLRSVGPLALAFLSVFVSGLWLSASAARYVGGLRPGSKALEVLTATCVAALGAFAAAAFVVRSARRYAKKRTSDQMIFLNLFWLLYTEWHCLTLASESWAWAAAGLSAYAAYRVVLWLGLRPLREAARRRGSVGLLLLRGFGARARSERALAELALRWRYVGSIQLIAGEDLATAGLEPHEFLDFITRRLERRYVKGPADLERKVHDADTRPDPDGRFRVNELFCHEDTWREAMTRLAGVGQVVLIDLRGFGRPGRRVPGTPPGEALRGTGLAFELRRLVDIEPTGRTVMVFDRTTELDYVEEVLRAAWEGMASDSPNRREPADPVRLLRLGGRGQRDSLRLLSMLCAAARPARGG